jgi:metal-responsive CopG/Arc/MetJ family transcriptional regulator
LSTPFKGKKSMSEKVMIPLAVTIEEGCLSRIDAAYLESPYASRLEFIRYLIDSALTEWERINE